MAIARLILMIFYKLIIGKSIFLSEIFEIVIFDQKDGNQTILLNFEVIGNNDASFGISYLQLLKFCQFQREFTFLVPRYKRYNNFVYLNIYLVSFPAW